MQLDWERLRLFHAVAEAGSFTEAARRLHMSQPALSRQIQGLEASINAKLFHRHARGLAMTHEGEQLHQATRDMAEAVDRTQASIEASRDRPTGENHRQLRLDLAGTPDGRFPQSLPRYHRHHAARRQ